MQNVAGGVAGKAPGAVTIERMRWWHFDDLLPIEEDLFGPDQWTAAMFWGELAAGHHYVIARAEPAPDARNSKAAGEGEIVGYAGLAFSPPAEAWINNLAVRRDDQRRGIGSMLLEHLLATAQTLGARQVLLEVAADNGPAQLLYDRYGFDVIGVRKGYYQATKTDALVMRRMQPPPGAGDDPATASPPQGRR